MAAIERDDCWELPYAGMRVRQIELALQLTLSLDGDAEIQIDTECLLSGVPAREDPAAVFALVGKEVVTAVAYKTGDLRMVFTSGTMLTVAPHMAYESWNARGPGSLLLISMPGGKVAIWS